MYKRFLVVDDSKIARSKIMEFLSEFQPDKMDEAQEGLIALQRFQETAYDCVIMDLEMPNMKGNEAAKLMLDLNPNINIILVTSIVDKKELIGALKIGIKKILKKPVSFEMFSNVVNELESRG